MKRKRLAIHTVGFFLSSFIFCTKNFIMHTFTVLHICIKSETLHNNDIHLMIVPTISGETWSYSQDLIVWLFGVVYIYIYIYRERERERERKREMLNLQISWDWLSTLMQILLSILFFLFSRSLSADIFCQNQPAIHTRINSFTAIYFLLCL